MQQRSVVMVVVLSIITFGIYALVWMVKTKNEMNTQGAQVPTAWMLLIPFIGPLLFQWKYAAGVELVTRGKQSQVIAFILLFVLGIIGMAIIQAAFNDVSKQQLPQARVA